VNELICHSPYDSCDDSLGKARRRSRGRHSRGDASRRHHTHTHNRVVGTGCLVFAATGIARDISPSVVPLVRANRMAQDLLVAIVAGIHCDRYGTRTDFRDQECHHNGYRSRNQAVPRSSRRRSKWSKNCEICHIQNIVCSFRGTSDVPQNYAPASLNHLSLWPSIKPLRGSSNVHRKPSLSAALITGTE